MEYVEFIKEYKRMCKSHEGCKNCLIGEEKRKKQIGCGEFIQEYPEEAEELLQKWIDENTVMTNKDKFFEVFGKADYLGGGNICGSCYNGVPCGTCNWWNQPYKGVEK